MPAVNFKAIIEKVREIPPMPESVVHLMEIPESNRYFTEEFTAIIESDPSLTASIMKVANSAYTSQNREITSVKDAVIILGRNLVISTAIRSFSSEFFDRDLPGYGQEGESLWKHSFATAIASSVVARFGKGNISAETSFTAGIVHDIGKVLISEHMEDRVDVLLARLNKGETSDYLAGERELLGTDHCEIGGMLAENWNLPETFVESIRYHHHPSMAERHSREVVSAVHIGDTLAMMMGVSTGCDCMRYRLDRTLTEALGISPDDMGMLMAKVREKYRKRMEKFNWG